MASYCSENYQIASEWSVIDTFTTMQYIECPTPTNTFSNNIIITEETAFIDLNWDSMIDLDVDHFLLIRYNKMIVKIGLMFQIWIVHSAQEL